MIQKETYNDCATDINSLGLSISSINIIAQNAIVPINNLLSIYNNQNPQSLNSGNNKINYFQPMINSLNVIKDNNKYSIKTKNFVQKLQIHVARNFGSVNNYLIEKDIKVGEKFAQVSGQVGYIINSGNIE